MSTPKNTLRNIVIFSTPLGPQGTASSSGSESLYPGNWLLSPTWAQHWGLLIQDETDSSGAMDTFFELYRPENTIDVLRRSRAEREASETANPSSVSYQNTAFKTDWTDDEIEQCGRNLCSQQMNGTYVLTQANCQTLVNLLANRIAFGTVPIAPSRTISHHLFGGLSRTNLFAVNEFDRANSEILKAIPLRESRDPTRDTSDGAFAEIEEHPSGHGYRNAPASSGISDDDLINMDEGERPNGPLLIHEVRSNARFWSQNPTSPGPNFEPPPPISLPKGYHEWVKSQKNRSNAAESSGQDSPPVFQPAPERFPGPPSPYIKWLQDEVGCRFSRMVEYQRNSKARAEEMELWLDPNIPQEQREKRWMELSKKENEYLRKERVAMIEQMKAHDRDRKDSRNLENPHDLIDLQDLIDPQDVLDRERSFRS